jgi:hypothetical protein
MIRATLLLVVLGVLTSTSLVDASIIISEIMYNANGTDKDPAATPPFDREWVEIYNTSSGAIDLTGWQFGSASTGQWTTPLPAGTTLGAGRPLVITGDASTFDANWGPGLPRIQVGSFPTLGNTSATIAIRNAAGVTQDHVAYGSSGIWPTSRGSQGNSIALLPQALDAAANNIGSNWHPSSGGLYGGRYVNGGGHGENNGSPGYVPTVVQAPFAPTPNASWSMVVFPDTQNYSKDSRDKPIFSQMTNWVKNNKDLFNIQLVMQVGDIVNQNSQVTPTSGDQTANQQWANAREAMSILDGHVPYIITLGNHDMGTTSAQTRDTQFNSYFNATQNPLVDPAKGGILKGYKDPGKLENAYFELNAPDGRKLLVFALEFWPRQSTVAWANQIASLSMYRDHTAVLLTHSYMASNGQRANANPNNYGVGVDSNDGEQLWQELVKLNGNFEMTFSGHVGGDGVAYLRSIGDNGNAVHQMLLNAQFETNGGNGWFSVLEFLDDGKTVRSRTYSPFLNLYRSDPANDYYFQLSPLPTPVYAAADFNRDGLVDGDDLALWSDNFGLLEAATPQQGDADGDLDVDGADFLVWQREFTGNSASAAVQSAVPEPSAALLCVLAGVVALASRRGLR